MAGYEGACHINRAGQRLDMLAATGHDTHADQDYGLLHEFGIGAVRDGFRWHLIDQGAAFDFASAAPMVAAAERHGLQGIWTLCHYGLPDGLDLFAPAFVERFARYCGALARFVASQSSIPPIYIPVNEISFFCWAAGEVGYMHPFAHQRGGELKRQLVRAAIAGCEAIWEADPRARVAHVEPLIHVVPPRNRPDLVRAAWAVREAQFEAWNMLAGQTAPELGGHPRYLDLLGVNFYYANQWEHASDRPAARLPWEEQPRDPRWVPLHRLLAEVHGRYGRPLFLSETSHFGVGRAAWLLEVADEVALALRHDVPVAGICIYPIVDRPDWDDPSHWHHAGLWDVAPDQTRLLNEEYAAALRQAQRDLQAQLVSY